MWFFFFFVCDQINFLLLWLLLLLLTMMMTKTFFTTTRGGYVHKNIMLIILFWAVSFKLSLREPHTVFTDYTKSVGSLLKICPQVFSLWTFNIFRKDHALKKKKIILCVTFWNFLSDSIWPKKRFQSLKFIEKELTSCAKSAILVWIIKKTPNPNLT